MTSVSTMAAVTLVRGWIEERDGGQRVQKMAINKNKQDIL